MLVNDSNFRQVENEISEIVENDESSKLANSQQWLVYDGYSIAQNPLTGASSKHRQNSSVIESIEQASESEQQDDAKDKSFDSNRDQSSNYDPSSERRHLRQDSASEAVVNLHTLKRDLLRKEPKKLTIAETQLLNNSGFAHLAVHDIHRATVKKKEESHISPLGK